MKIILSRKGFDSANGGQPNPILPDGTLLSLPIPDKKKGNNPYGSLVWNGQNYFDIIRSLKPNTKLKADSMCHLDPDLRKDVRDREKGWQPAFGQTDTALKHLRNQGVSFGDLFLFFGWFRQTEMKDDHLVYKKDAADIHAIYGYMEIGSIIENQSDVPKWLKDHPHADCPDAWADHTNAIYLPTNNLSFLPTHKGCDVLGYRNDRVLTKPGMSRCYWDLPDFFKKVEITYNPSPWRNGCFKSAGRGQEFVMDATPEILDWVKQIIS
jgi:hypothetical protein